MADRLPAPLKIQPYSAIADQLLLLLLFLLSLWLLLHWCE